MRFIVALLVAVLYTFPLSARNLASLVQELEYGPAVADSIGTMLQRWKGRTDHRLVRSWEKRLKKAGKAGGDKLFQTQKDILSLMGRILTLHITGGAWWDLRDVIKHGAANCVGYAQLLHVIGNYVGFTVKYVEVLQTVDGKQMDSEGHVCSLIGMADGRVMLLDPGRMLFSEPFRLEEEYVKKGSAWILKDNKNPFGLHRRIRLASVDDMIADRWYNTGHFHQAAGRTDSALVCFQKAVERRPCYADAHNHIGALLENKKKMEGAIRHYRRAAACDPRHAHALNNIGAWYFNTGNTDSALVYFKLAVARNPRQSVSHYNIGHVYSVTGQTDSAIVSFQKAAGYDKGLAESYNNLGTVYFSTNRLDSAVIYFKKTISVDADNVYAHLNLGITYGELKDNKKAAQYFTRTALLAPEKIGDIRKLSERYGIKVLRD